MVLLYAARVRTWGLMMRPSSNVEPADTKPTFPFDRYCYPASEFAMFADMQRRYHWILPTHHYDIPEQLIADLDERVIRPAEDKVLELRQLQPG